LPIADVNPAAAQPFSIAFTALLNSYFELGTLPDRHTFLGTFPGRRHSMSGRMQMPLENICGVAR
jgi:hypothetical protein